MIIHHYTFVSGCDNAHQQRRCIHIMPLYMAMLLLSSVRVKLVENCVLSKFALSIWVCYFDDIKRRESWHRTDDKRRTTWQQLHILCERWTYIKRVLFFVSPRLHLNPTRFPRERKIWRDLTPCCLWHASTNIYSPFAEHKTRLRVSSPVEGIY